MADKELESIHVTKADNGGHTVRHEFKRQTVKRGGSMNGGMYSERPDSEEHSFGAGDQQEHAVMTHIAKALGFTKVAKAEGAEDKGTGKGGKEY